MKDIFSFREHQFVEIGGETHGLTLPEVNELLALAESSGQPFCKLHMQNRKTGLKFQQFAGTIHLSTGRAVEILPKVPGAQLDNSSTRSLIMHLVHTVTGRSDWVGRIGSSKSGLTLSDAYIDATQVEIWRQLRQGLDRNYVSKERTDPAVRGRILWHHQLNRYPGRHDRFVQIYPRLSEETDLNSTLALAVQSMLTVVRDPRIRSELLKLNLVFSEFRKVGRRGGANSIAFDRLNSRWQLSYDLCLQWLSRQSPGIRAGHEGMSPSLLFDMNRLFEEYIRSNVAKIAPGYLRHRSRGTPMYCNSRNSSLLDLLPDLEIKDPSDGGHGLAIVCDAKWKLGCDQRGWKPSPDDLRQIYAYAKILGYSRAALLFPTLSADPRVEHFYSNEKDSITLTLAQFPIGPECGTARRDLIRATIFGERSHKPQAA